MQNYLFQAKQELDKVGPVYSNKDEKQRAIVKDILALKIKPELHINVNPNIPGLDKKKVIGSKNPAVLRFWAPMSQVGRSGIRYLNYSYNNTRFHVPVFLVLFYYYALENYSRATYFDKEWNNFETESAYLKLQTFKLHFSEKSSLMA